MITKVSIRRRPISGGRDTLYLEFYPPIQNAVTYKKVKSKSLGIYIHQNPRTKEEREFNKVMLYKAEALRCLKFQELMNNKYNFYDEAKLALDFLEYFQKKSKRKSTKWQIVYSYFESFTNGKCRYADVTIELCRNFRDYLLNASKLKNASLKIKHNSAAGYYGTFIAMLREAQKERIIQENITEHLDTIKWKDVKKEFLTLEELHQLSNTPCHRPILKSASLFACLTGLRLGDILNLKWENIMPRTNGGFCMRICIEKTQSETTLPLSDEAYELCGDPDSGKVFKGFERCMVQQPLKRWLSEVGIARHISFHMRRHVKIYFLLKANVLQNLFHQ